MFPVSFVYYRVCVIVQCFLVVSTKLNDVCTILSAWSNNVYMAPEGIMAVMCWTGSSLSVSIALFIFKKKPEFLALCNRIGNKPGDEPQASYI